MRLLLVEDEKDIVNFLKPSLEAECLIVDVAEDGDLGADLAMTNDYDLIILDNMLPGKDGKSICAEIRKGGKNVPILMLSVKSEVNIKVDLLNAGADDYLTKPFALDELIARVKALLRRPQKIEGDILRIDNLVLDTKKQQVKRGGRDIILTRKEFMLLEYMIRNRGVVLSRGMIMEHVWDMNADPFSNTIESHILSLRKKVDQNGDRKLIYTVPARGYKMDLNK